MEYTQAEVRKIIAIDGRKLVLNETLKFHHYGQLETYYPPWQPNGVVLNERAEVIRLTRNILIQGDSDVVPDYKNHAGAIGGHFMVGMTDPTIRPISQAYLSNVEFNRMGKTGFNGRYPVHLHLLDNASGQYIKNVSVHHSFQRCFTIHATSNLDVKDNSCFDHFGHGLFLEEGSEMGNTFDHNIVAGTKAINGSIALLATDVDHAASFW